jgi:predicted cupin superfamily sugar epimerase
MEAQPLITDLTQMSAAEVREHLDLEYLEGEGVWFRLLWRTEFANAIYALITRDDFSALHRLAEDEMWVHVAGAPARQHLLHPDGLYEEVLLGTGVQGGQVPQSRVLAGTWQGARSEGDWTLVVCVLAPPFSGFELASEQTDLQLWSDHHEAFASLVRKDVP